MDQQVSKTDKTTFIADYVAAFDQETSTVALRLWGVIENLPSHAPAGCRLEIARWLFVEKSSHSYQASVAEFDRASGNFQLLLQFSHTQQVRVWFRRSGANPPSLLSSVSAYLVGVNKLFAQMNVRAVSFASLKRHKQAVKKHLSLLRGCPAEVAVLVVIYLISRTRKVSMKTSVSRTTLVIVLKSLRLPALDTDAKIGHAIAEAARRGDLRITKESAESFYLLDHGRELAVGKLST